MMNSRALMMDSRALMTPPPNPTELHVTGVLLSKMTQALAYRMLRSRLYILVKKHNWCYKQSWGMPGNPVSSKWKKAGSAKGSGTRTSRDESGFSCVSTSPRGWHWLAHFSWPTCIMCFQRLLDSCYRFPPSGQVASFARFWDPVSELLWWNSMDKASRSRISIWVVDLDVHWIDNYCTARFL